MNQPDTENTSENTGDNTSENASQSASESIRTLPRSGPPSLRRERPWQVTIIAILSIVIGYLGVLLKPVTTLPYFTDMRWLRSDWTAPTLFPGEWAFQVFFVMGLGFMQSTLCLISGMGLLRLREWARKGILAYAALSVLMTIGFVAFQIYASDAVVQRVQATTTSVINTGEVRAQHLGMVITSSLIRLPFLFLIFGFMTATHVRRAFDRQRLVKSA